MPYAPKLRTRGSSIRNEDAKELIVACVSTLLCVVWTFFAAQVEGLVRREPIVLGAIDQQRVQQVLNAERKRMSNLICRISDVGCRISDFVFRISDLGSRMLDVGFRISDVGCRTSILGCQLSDV